MTTFLNVADVPRLGVIDPSVQPVDPVTLAAELEVRLKEQGTPPGARYRRADAVKAMVAYLRAADIPMVGAA